MLAFSRVIIMLFLVSAANLMKPDNSYIFYESLLSYFDISSFTFVVYVIYFFSINIENTKYAVFKVS